uniref:Uncharacterized protein n=1 Tax=Strongyloides venezuelensis TaxID=75913 RepID=A0A0K0FSS2_STRVS
MNHARPRHGSVEPPYKLFYRGAILFSMNHNMSVTRNYLNMKNIINLSYNTNEHQYVYEMKFCRKVNVIGKIINDGYKGNICYTRIPVVT